MESSYCVLHHHDSPRHFFCTLNFNFLTTNNVISRRRNFRVVFNDHPELSELWICIRFLTQWFTDSCLNHDNYLLRHSATSLLIHDSDILNCQSFSCYFEYNIVFNMFRLTGRPKNWDVTFEFSTDNPTIPYIWIRDLLQLTTILSGF